MVLDMPLRDIEHVLYFEAYAVIAVFDRRSTDASLKMVKRQSKR